MTDKKHECPNFRPSHESLEVKITVPINPNGFPHNLSSVIDRTMKAHGGEFEHQGTSLVSGDKDFIYRFSQVVDEAKLLDDLKSDMSAKLNCPLTLKSFAPLDAYPGDASLYGYRPGHLVRERR